MSNSKTSDAMERAMQEALESVERIEREGADAGDDPIETEVEPPEPAQDETAEAATAAGAGDQLEEVRGQMLRLAADFENFRKRSQREREEIRQFGIEGVLRDLLGVVDNLDRALEHANDEADPFVQGVRMISKQLVDTLSTHGARPFESMGDVFDPERHEAMSQVPTNEAEPGTVIHQLEKGYWLHDRLLRPAKVVVAAAAQPEPRAEQQPAESISEAQPGADEETGVDEG